jgi:hypothetical protein
MQGMQNRQHNPEDFITLPSGHRVLKREFLSNNVPARNPDRVIVDKLPSISGSIAGASSRFLQTVQKHKAIEEARVSKLEAEAKNEKEQAEFEQQRFERKRQFDEEAAKKRDKRKRRKMGKSQDGLSLPADIVTQIKEQERTEHVPLDTIKQKPSHPLASGGFIPITNQPRIPLSKPPLSHQPQQPTIRIIDEDS